MTIRPDRVFVGVAWPYANGSLHAGHMAGAYLPADIFARFARMTGASVLFVSGSDCHGAPITFRADETGDSPRAVVTMYHEEFLRNWDEARISFDLFTTTMTDMHIAVVQDEFELLRNKGLLVEQPATALYDEVAGRFLPDRYVVGECAHCGFEGTRGDQCSSCGRPLDADDILNPTSKATGDPVVRRDTRHFFLDLPQLERRLKAWVAGSRKHWRPHVAGETQKFLDEGLRARAITRNLDWGVPIPVEGWDDRRIYVWFEAVTGYLSASMEWAQGSGDAEAWRQWWDDPDARQYYFLGKDNIPFHTLIWPAILMGRGDVVQLPYNVPANCFLQFSGEKASKSEGIGASLKDLFHEYESDAVRFYLTAIMPEHDDASFDHDELEARVNSELIGTWGNLVSRTSALVVSRLSGIVPEVEIDEEVREACEAAVRDVTEHLWDVELRKALRRALECAQFGNGYLNRHKPWDAAATEADVGNTLGNALFVVNTVKTLMAPFVPDSSAELHRRLGYADSLENEPMAAAAVPPGRHLEKLPALYKKLAAGALTGGTGAVSY